jgi:hypothetical protein
MASVSTDISGGALSYAYILKQLPTPEIIIKRHDFASIPHRCRKICLPIQLDIYNCNSCRLSWTRIDPCGIDDPWTGRRKSVGKRGASWQGNFLWIYLNFLTTRFTNWRNESDSNFNSLWIDRICLQCSITRNCEIEKNYEKKTANLPHLRVSWQLTILHCPKISRSNFENFATKHLVKKLYANMPLKISDN